MNKLPSSVTLAGIKYDIVEVEKLIDDDGITKLNGNIKYAITQIQIEKNLSDQLKIVTLWHEVIHGLLGQAEIEHEEKIVSVLGYGICGFIQDNPEMVK